MQKTSHKNDAKTRIGFSLMEIVTVLAILSILVAIAFPVFFSVRERTRRATCTSNLRELGTASSMYVSDYDGRYPPCYAANSENGDFTNQRVSWRYLLSPYMGNTFPRCPSVLLPSYFNDRNGEAESLGYCYNLAFTHIVSIPSKDPTKKKIQPIGKSETALEHPEQMVVFFDARPGITGAWHPDTATNLHELENTGITPIAMSLKLQIAALPPGALRHAGGANYVYADGHVEWFAMKNLFDQTKIKLP